MKIFLVAQLAVDTQAWARDYGTGDGSEASVLADVATYFNNEVIAGTPAAQGGGLTIVDVAQVRSARSSAQRVGTNEAASVPMLLQISVEVDKNAWAQSQQLDASDADTVTADVVGYFDLNVFEGCAPVASKAIELLDIEHRARPRKPVAA